MCGLAIEVGQEKISTTPYRQNTGSHHTWTICKPMQPEVNCDPGV